MVISRRVLAHAMTAIAGWVDTVGIMLFFEELNIFPTYMSGNTTRLFVSAVRGEVYRLSLYGAAIVLFFLGAGLGRWVNNGSRGREAAALLLEGALILAAALAAASAAPQTLTLGLLAMAMGWNNVALTTRGGVGPKGYITGTLVSVATAVSDALCGRAAWSKAGEPALIWLSLALGALAGAYATKQVAGPVVLLVPALVVALCGTAVAARWTREPEA